MMRAITLLSLTAILATGCNQPERLGDSAPVDPRRTSPIVALNAIQLQPHTLTTHADYDRWEDAVLARSGASLPYMLYKDSLIKKRGTQRTFVRWMLISYHDELSDDFREPLRKFIEGLAGGENLSADVRYLLGFIAWKQLLGGPGSPAVPKSLRNMALVDTVTKNWQELLKKKPDWVGPRGITANDLQQRITAMEASLSPTAPTVDAPVTAPDTVGTWVLGEVARLYPDAPVPWQDQRTKRDEAFQDFYAIYEDKGPKKGCERIDVALKALGDMTALGDAYAHCAIDRKNPAGAVAQLRRMIAARRPGGIPMVLVRLDALAKNDATLAKILTDLRVEIAAAAAKSPLWARQSGLMAPKAL